MAAKTPAGEAHPHVAAANAYARGVVSGKIPACQWVRLACQRHLDDLKRRGPDWEFKFDPAAAEKACRFIELLPFSKARWALQRKLFKLEPWQCFLTISIFGWLRKSDGKRRFREVFLLIPRKNGKSEWAAAVGLYMLLCDGEHGAEVYSGATTEKQAWWVFGAARRMALNSPKMAGHFGLTVNASNLHVLANSSKFEPIIGNPGDGSSPTCAIHDEYHEHQTDAQVDTMATGMGAREQPLQIIITTAGDNIAGPCFAAQVAAQKMLSGVLPNERLFAVIWGIDATDKWDSDLALRKANPNLDVSVDMEFLRAERTKAISQPNKQGRFKTKHLNVWVQARAAYFNLERFLEVGDPSLRLADFRGERCYIGLDLASKIDLAALMILFPRDPDPETGKARWATFGRYYLPEETVQSPENEHYQRWEATIGHNGGPALDDDGEFESWKEAPLLDVTEGAITDFEHIRQDILALTKVFQVEVVAYDPAQATYLVTKLMEDGVPVLEYRPTVINFSEPMKELDAWIRDRALAYDGDPVLAWAISNTVAKADAKDNVYPRKEIDRNKIDPTVALISAIGAMKLAPGSTESVYEERGLLELDI